jgi:hypothetical protein
MKVNSVSAEYVDARLNEAELSLLNNALNEILNGIDIEEFETRLGASRRESRALLEEIGSILAQMAQLKIDG